ncbi:hypothetical protein J6590_062725 [Homalodisca vitripennis]|nr:hypothetical protein J6590_062725 [Homalodisca vitripennis]
MAATQSKKKNKQELTKTQTIGGGDIVADFIEDVWKVITPEMVERFRCVLMEDFGLSKKDADKLIQDQRNIRRQRICLKANKINVRIGPRNQWIKEISRSIADQLAMFVVGMLLSNRNTRSKRIAEKVLEHLCDLTGENATIQSAKTRVERTLVVVADRMATWIDEAITDIESKIEEKFKTAVSLEDLSRESLITLRSSTVESEESETSVCSDKISEKEEYGIESEVTLSLTSVESLEKESKESLSEDKSGEEEAVKSKEEEESEEEKLEDKSEEEKSEEDRTEGVSEGESEDETDDEESFEKEKVESEEIEDEESVEEEEKGEEEEEVEEEEEEDEEVESEEDKEEAEKGEEEEEKEEIEEPESIVEEIEKESVREIESLASEISIETDQIKLPTDLLDLLKEDVVRMPKGGEKSDRQKAMKEVIDKRFEKIAKEKLEQSLSSLVKYDIEEAASIVANWVETILSSADAMPVEDLKPQGPAFEIKRGEGSQLQIYQISSTTVAQKVAEVRGLEPPPRKKKLPRTKSPINLVSSKDWADWALDAANIGEEWGKWLDEALADLEDHLLQRRPSVSQQDRYNAWEKMKQQRGSEATKWRVEKKKIKDEGYLWSRKLKKGPTETPEKEIKTLPF